MKNGKNTLMRVLRVLGKSGALMACSIALAAASVLLSLYVPILFGDAIDQILDDGVRFEPIVKFLTRAGIVAAVTAVVQWVMGVINNRITFETVRRVREQAFEKVERLPLKTIDNHAYGDLLSRVISDVDQFADGLLMGFSQFFTGIVTIFATLGFMLWISWRVAIVAALLTPLSIFVARFVAKNTHDLFKRQSEIRGEQTSLIDEMVGGARVVAAYGYQARGQERFELINRELETTSRKAIFISSLVNPSTRFVNCIVYAAVCFVGAMTAIGGGMTVGGLSAILSYATQFTKPFNEISGVLTELQNAMVCAQRIFELIDEQPEPSDENLPELPKVEGRVSVEDVSFSYTPERPLIQGFNLKVEPGQRVAIVGPTGCGKTTLINLLMRFYDVNSGRITVEGMDISKVKRSSLRRGYGMVLQDTWLRSGTIRDNIIMGKPDATEEEIVAAAKATHAHSFIKRLPKGYDTVVGEDGGSLSAGQRQLLCITRVMLSAPPMLILDEATSSIDTKTEMRVQRAFEKLMKGKTSFIVAHRLSTIMSADVILVMKSGNVVEQGTHRELMARGGFYAELYNSQFAH